MQESKVDAQSAPFLHAWDSRARKFGQFFQVHTQAAREDISKIGSSPLTSWRDVTQRQGYY